MNLGLFCIEKTPFSNRLVTRFFCCAMDSQSSKETNISDLPADAWRILGQSLNLVDIYRLFLTGSSSLNNALQRVQFSSLSCSECPKSLQKITSIAKLRSKMSLFAQLHTQSLTLDKSFKSPQILYVASQALASDSKRASMRYDLQKSDLQSISWLKFANRFAGVTLVRAEEETDDLGGHATIEKLAMFMTLQKNSGGDYDEEDDVGAEKTFGQPENIVNFPADDLVSGLPKLASLHLYPTVSKPPELEGEHHFDLRNIPSLTSFSIAFTSVLCGRATGITVIGGPSLTSLSFENYMAQEYIATFALDTHGVPNLRKLHLTAASWPLYYRMHKSSLDATLEELSLRTCPIGDVAWTVQWPPRLTSLTIRDAIIAEEIGVDYPGFEFSPRTFLFNLNNLPAGLQHLALHTEYNDSFDDFAAMVADSKDWSAIDELEAKRPRDWEALLNSEEHFVQSSNAAIVVFGNKCTLVGALPCANLKSLQLGHSCFVPSLLDLPKSLTSIDCSGLMPRIHRSNDSYEMFQASLAMAFPGLDFGGGSLPSHLRSIKLPTAFWTYLLPISNDPIFSGIKKLGYADVGLETNAIVYDLNEWLLRSMAVKLSGKLELANWNELGMPSKASLIEHAWIAANAGIRSETAD